MKNKLKSSANPIELIKILKQVKIDHEQHYDLDGVTQESDDLVIPSSSKIQCRLSKTLLSKKIQLTRPKKDESKDSFKKPPIPLQKSPA